MTWVLPMSRYQLSKHRARVFEGAVNPSNRSLVQGCQDWGPPATEIYSLMVSRLEVQDESASSVVGEDREEQSVPGLSSASPGWLAILHVPCLIDASSQSLSSSPRVISVCMSVYKVPLYEDTSHCTWAHPSP